MGDSRSDGDSDEAGCGTEVEDAEEASAGEDKTEAGSVTLQPKKHTRFTRSQLKKDPPSLQAPGSRDLRGSSTASVKQEDPPRPSRLPGWGSTSDTALAIGDKIKVWLPKGTTHPSRKAWVARRIDSDVLLGYRVPLNAPPNVTTLCKDQGRWFRVHVTESGNLQLKGCMRLREPPLDEDALPRHLRGPPPPASSWTADALPVPGFTSDSCVTIIMYAPKHATRVALEDLGGNEIVGLAQTGSTNCWRTSKPLPRGYGWSYVSVIEVPGKFFGTKKVRTSPRRVAGASSGLTMVDFGDGEPHGVRARRMAKSLLNGSAFHLPEHVVHLRQETAVHA